MDTVIVIRFAAVALAAAAFGVIVYRRKKA
jgi:hypothetical protein